MARTQNPFIGRAKGSIGNTVLTKQYKHNTARSKPLTVKNPDTDDQQEVRGKMRLIGHLIMLIGTALRSYLPKAMADMPTTSWFIKTLSLNSVYTKLTDSILIDETKAFGGNFSFWGSELLAELNVNSVELEFNVSEINPVQPKTAPNLVILKCTRPRRAISGTSA